MSAALTFLIPLIYINRSLQVVIADGRFMSDEVHEEPTTGKSGNDAIEELTIEERQVALKRARWNVFLYLGLAALLFGFALYPFMSTTMDVDEGAGSAEIPIRVWGIPVAGEDFTDIPVEIDVKVQSLPTDVNNIEIFIVENPEGCDARDGSFSDTMTKLQNGESEHPNNYHIIEGPVESETYSIEMKVDPGIYCVRVAPDSTGSGINVNADVALYPTQLPLAIFAVMCLLMSGFAFIGAQKHGKHVKSLVEPKKEPSIEDSVLAQTSEARIAAGPSGPPTSPTGPPAPGPTGPPAPGPTGPPVLQETVEAPAPETVAEPVAQDVYEDQGNGWFFRKFPDGTYDQKVYVIKDGFYVPHEEPSA